MIVRVISKHSSYVNFFFLDLLQYDGSIVSVLIRKNPPHANKFDKFPFVHVGDVIRIETREELNDKGSVCLTATEIEVIELWENLKFGPFVWKRNSQFPQPIAFVQAQDDVLVRVQQYLEEYNGECQFQESNTPVSKSQDRLLMVGSPSKADEICTSIMNNAVLGYAVSRIYMLGDNPVMGFTIREVVEHISNQQIPNIMGIRVQAFPKWMSLCELEASELKFSPTKYSHVLTLVFANGFFYASLVPEAEAIGAGDHIGPSGRSPEFISKASAKLAEAWQRIDVGKKINNMKYGLAIDIGASPGGWSAYLKNVAKFDRVIAVDKGALHPSLSTTIDHWEMKGEEAIEKLLLDGPKIDCFVCDMNCDLTDTVALFVKTIPLLSSSFRAVITFKQTLRNKQQWKALKQGGIESLQLHIGEVYNKVEIREVHLIANTPKETTILVRASEHI